MATTDAAELAKAYDPRAVESKLYARWLAAGYFKPRIDPHRRPFTIVMPPPNVTGRLHIGHALTAAIEDALVRWHRMLGEPTLWVPGKDHAGIATQVVVERELAQQGLTRHDLGRERFLEKVWEWVRTYGSIIDEQHKRLGVSCDWDRLAFTMDPGPARAVRTMFKRLYDKGLIYRGARITNWCPRCQTALSDLEVEYHEDEGILAYVRYPLAGREGEYLTIATTRPETILADTAVAVNPADPRYQAVIGVQVRVPGVDREVPVVADSAVEMEFGTGALKITPGHDPVDFEIGQRHNLPAITVIGLDGRMTAAAGAYAGLSVEEARERFLAELQARGLLERVEPYRHRVGHCQRCKTVVEPLITEQWYVRIQPLAAPAIAAVREGRIRIIPERFEKVYFNWMENIRDWCISRQLWWGHRIPVWYCRACPHELVAVETPTACPECGGPLEQDPDVLDTWFSSGLWPFSTLGWPDDTPDLRYFYPNTLMETGYDILFFWVARMIMLGIEAMGEVPFRDVYLHGLIRVEGKKMSKTAGNVLDPLELMDEYGTDATRLALTVGTTPGNDTELNLQKLEACRNFVNKLWNSARYVLLNVPAAERPATLAPLTPPEGASAPDRWIVSRANHVAAEVTRLLHDYQLGEAARTVQEFLWGEYCDWYLEMAKIQLRVGGAAAQAATRYTLTRVLEQTLRLLHPFAPFVTEELWQTLLAERLAQAEPALPPSIMVAPWPVPGPRDAGAEAFMEDVIELIRAARNLRQERKVEPARYVPATVVGGTRTVVLRAVAPLISGLARLQPLEIVEQLAAPPRQALPLVAGGFEAYLPAAELFDVVQERARLARELTEVERLIASGEARLANPGFTQKAPAAVVEGARRQLAENRERRERLAAQLRALEE
ncbi:MAG: valine--tRNA ligase [Chloroflexi bacterium]|nr:valine--tRNA ligase [Chloroflexota bacterium]